jgi:protein-S-isoprenylcysteine O-methyltransferase Ste14
MLVSKQQRIFFGDLLGRVGIVVYFIHAAALEIATMQAGVAQWQTLTIDHKELWFLSQLATLLFLLLVAVTTIFRLKPIVSSEGIEPRITALGGTFLLGLLALTPNKVDLPPALMAVALILVIVGFSLSTYVLNWLGRSFSIMAEARELVTGGPYAYVRHPLYLTEEIAIIGIVLINFSLPALLIAVVHWLLQLRRMHNEERVLTAAFPDYADYAALTPKIIPQLPSFSGKSA